MIVDSGLIDEGNTISILGGVQPIQSFFNVQFDATALPGEAGTDNPTSTFTILNDD